MELTLNDIQEYLGQTGRKQDSEFLKCPWSSNGYRAYEGKVKAKPKKEEVAEDLSELIPF